MGRFRSGIGHVAEDPAPRFQKRRVETHEVSHVVANIRATTAGSSLHRLPASRIAALAADTPCKPMRAVHESVRTKSMTRTARVEVDQAMTASRRAIDAPAGTRHPCAVALSITSLPRYLFTGRFLQILRHLPNFARLYWRLFRDGRVPILPKALLVLTLVYVISPFDVIPDVIPVIGEMDDVMVVLSGLWLFIRLCPPEVVRDIVDDIAARANARG